MVVLVPIRTQSAFAHVDDVDAKNMGLMEDEKQRLNCDEQQRVQTLKTRAEDKAQFRSEREAFQKIARRVAVTPNALQMQGNRAEKRSLPGFLKVRNSAEGFSTGADDLEQGQAQASSSSQCVTQTERKRPRLDLEEAQGDGGSLSATAAAIAASSSSGATVGSVSLVGYSQEAQNLEGTLDATVSGRGSAGDPDKLLAVDNADNADGGATSGRGIGLTGYSSDESSPACEEADESVENPGDNEDGEEEAEEHRK